MPFYYRWTNAEWLNSVPLLSSGEIKVQMLLLTNTDLRLHYIFRRVEAGKRIGRNVNLGVCDSTVHYSSVRYRFTCLSNRENAVYIQDLYKNFVLSIR